METKQAEKKPHSINLENRSHAALTGVEKVVSSNENCITLLTSGGELVIFGANLKINKFDNVSGQLSFEGTVNKLQYSAGKEKLIKRIFK